jgi:hypothetical protein
VVEKQHSVERSESDSGEGLWGELPEKLDSLEGDLRAVQELIGGTRGEYVGLTDLGPKPLTVRLMQEARLKRELKVAERRARAAAKKPKRKKTHYMVKRAGQRKGCRRFHKATYRKDIEHRYSRWKRRARTKREGIGMTLEEYGSVWGRIDPRTGEPLFKAKRVVWWRKNAKKPWTLDNINDTIEADGMMFKWAELAAPSQEL